MEIIECDKRKKGVPSIKVSFCKDKLTHYPFGSGQVNNYKFLDTLEFVERTKEGKNVLIEWKSTTNDRTYYSAVGLLNNVCLGLAGEIKQAKKLTVEGKFTFVKIGVAVLLTISKN
jgi:hypothetical protein